MSWSAVLIEGVRRAAFLAAWLFTFNSAGAQGLSPLTIDGSIAGSGLTLAEHHVDAHIASGTARVRTRLLLRNDSGDAVSVQYVLSHAANVAHGEVWDLHAAEVKRLWDDDLPTAAAELAETTVRKWRVLPHEVIVVPAGDQIVLEVEREMPVAGAGAVHRLELPLPVDRTAPWVPRFTADVLVEADRPIVRLESPTHEALVDGVGSRTALLSVADGFVYRQEQLAVEFEVEAARRSTPMAALDGAPATRSR